MKFFVYLMSAVLLLSIGGLFVMKRPDGQTWLSVKQFTPDLNQTEFEVKQFSKHAIKTIETVFSNKSEEVNKNVAVYRWKDEKGNWHFSDKPNEKTEEVILDRSKITILPSFKSDTDKTDITSNEKESTLSIPTPTTIGPDKIKNLIQDAKNVQSLIDDRENKISDSIDNNT